MSHFSLVILDKLKLFLDKLCTRKTPATQSYISFSKIAVKSPESKVFDTTIGCGYQLVSIPSYGLTERNKPWLYFHTDLK